MNCVKCGNPLSEGAKFCSVCGMPVPVEPPAEPTRVVVPYEPARMEGGNIIIPLNHRYRILCPDCGRVSEALKTDQTPGYPCPVCKKAYAYMGQVLFYRMGSFYPLYAPLHAYMYIDGHEYGSLMNQDSVRLMIGPGPHTIAVKLQGMNRPLEYKLEVTPQYNTFAFKYALIYKGPFSYPGRGIPNELNPCAPEEIPNI